MNINLVITIAMPIVIFFLGMLINHLTENREKLISYIGYISSHKLDPIGESKIPIIIHAHSVIIRNNGKKAAKNVRLGHNFLPSINVHPDTEYSIKDLPGGGKEIFFPTLIPKKEVTISYIYFPPVTWNNINTHIESDEGPAKNVTGLLQTQPKPIVLKAFWVLVIIGIVATLYVAVEIVKWLIK